MNDGDNFNDDIQPALALGMKVLLVDRRHKYPETEVMKTDDLQDIEQMIASVQESI